MHQTLYQKKWTIADLKWIAKQAPTKTEDYTPEALNEYFNSIINPTGPRNRQQNVSNVPSDKPNLKFRSFTSNELLSA